MKEGREYSTPDSLVDIEGYIREQVEESLYLEYKSADAFGRGDGKKKEIAKDVSAMANSAGGVIVYGIKEFDDLDKRHLPERLDPVSRSEYTKEWLEQVINSNISPKIQGIQITVIPTKEERLGVYVVDIPQSSTAHQNTADHRYYKRYNFESVPMLDYEIRDILNRQKHPMLVLEFEITTESYEVHDPFPVQVLLGGKGEPRFRTEIMLQICPKNIGNVYANYVNYFVDIPAKLVNERDIGKLSLLNQTTARFAGDNTYRDVVDYQSSGFGHGYPKYGPSRYVPILPKLKGVMREIELNAVPGDDSEELHWTIHADNAEPIEWTVRLKDIPVSRITAEIENTYDEE